MPATAPPTTTGAGSGLGKETPVGLNEEAYRVFGTAPLYQSVGLLPDDVAESR